MRLKAKEARGMLTRWAQKGLVVCEKKDLII
jgi:hypothetical protein